MMKPAIQFLELLIERPEKIFEKYINKEINRRKGKIDFSSFLNKYDYDNAVNGNIFLESMVSKEIANNIPDKFKKKRNKKYISIEAKPLKTNVNGGILLDI